MKTLLVLTLTSFLGAAATAATLIDERFGNGVPPPAWTADHYGDAQWRSRTGGPWGPYAFAGASVTTMTGPSWAYMDTPALAATAGQTLYYRFMYLIYVAPGLGGANAELRLYAVSTGSVLGSWVRSVTNENWEEASGFVVIPSSGSVRARFWFDVYCGGMGGEDGEFSLDTFQLGTAPFNAVAPRSLGHVKALYR